MTVIDVELKKGGLSKYGHHIKDPAHVRRRALLNGAKDEGFLPLIRRLSFEATLLKNSSPTLSKRFKSDQRWLSKEYELWKEKHANGGLSSGLSKYSLLSQDSEDEEEEEEDGSTLEDEYEEEIREVYE